MVLNDTMSVISKSNNCERCRQKITNPLTIEKYVLVGSYFVHVSHLFNFDIDDVISFDTKCFFDVIKVFFFGRGEVLLCNKVIVIMV